jgi:hypothetical protein
LHIFLKISIFLNKKIKGFKKMPTEKEIIELLRRGKVSLPPLAFKMVELPEKEGKQTTDALLETSWQGKKATFAVKCKSLSTPKMFQNGLSQIKSMMLPKKYQPLLCLPFLNEQQLQELERERISGIDLCGNGVILVPGVFNVFRSGAKNRFPSSASIKNIYRKNTSMIGRLFLVVPAFKSVKEIHNEINQRNLLVKRWDKKPISLSTVSKSLKVLEDDLIIDRKENIRLIQADKLLEKLAGNYSPPKITEKVSLKVKVNSQSIRSLLSQKSQELKIPMIASGISSITQFATMQQTDLLSIYCPRVDILIDQLAGSQSDRFPNLEIIETDDETIYFDAQQKDRFRWASPIQVYLELMAGDKRDRETAEQVKSYILKSLKMVSS